MEKAEELGMGSFQALDVCMVQEELAKDLDISVVV